MANDLGNPQGSAGSFNLPHSGFFWKFWLEIQIGNQQVLGQNWVKKVVINKFSLGKK